MAELRSKFKISAQGFEVPDGFSSSFDAGNGGQAYITVTKNKSHYATLEFKLTGNPEAPMNILRHTGTFFLTSEGKAAEERWINEELSKLPADWSAEFDIK